MYSTRKRFWRLFAVMATMTAMLVPAAMAGAQVEDHECDEEHYDAANPMHVLYGRTQGTPVVGGYMVVDLSGEGSGRVVFHDDEYSPDPAVAGGFAVGAYIIGTPYADVICGTEGDDWIFGRQGNDRIFGMGNDSGYTAATLLPPVAESWGDNLFGNKGNDFVTPGDGNGIGDGTGSTDGAFVGGGLGNDVLYAGDGYDSFVRGGMGADSIYGAGDDQILRGGADNDYINAGGGDGTLAEGNAGDDTIIGGSGVQQILNGNNGNDRIIGGSGDFQRIFGGAGNDHLSAGDGYSDFAQALFGGSGNDLIDASTATSDAFWAFGGAGDDVIKGGADSDNLFGDYASVAGEEAETTSDWVEGAGGFAQPFPVAPLVTGNDTIWGGLGLDDIFGGPGNDTIYGNKPLVGPPNDSLDDADGSPDDLFGNDGDDLLFGQGSACDGDTANGGANHVAGDTSRGLALADTINVENVFDQVCIP